MHADVKEGHINSKRAIQIKSYNKEHSINNKDTSQNKHQYKQLMQHRTTDLLIINITIENKNNDNSKNDKHTELQNEAQHFTNVYIKVQTLPQEYPVMKIYGLYYMMIYLNGSRAK